MFYQADHSALMGQPKLLEWKHNLLLQNNCCCMLLYFSLTRSYIPGNPCAQWRLALSKGAMVLPVDFLCSINILCHICSLSLGCPWSLRWLLSIVGSMVTFTLSSWAWFSPFCCYSCTSSIWIFFFSFNAGFVSSLHFSLHVLSLLLCFCSP